MDDYHKVTDDVDKINFLKVARIAELTYQIVISLANIDRRFEIEELVRN